MHLILYATGSDYVAIKGVIIVLMMVIARIIGTVGGLPFVINGFIAKHIFFGSGRFLRIVGTISALVAKNVRIYPTHARSNSIRVGQ